MKNRFFVANNALRALSLFAASKDEVRKYLQGVWFEVSEGGQVRAVATDGHVVGVFSSDVPAETDVAVCVFVPTEVCRKLRKDTKTAAQHSRVVVDDEGKATLTQVDDGSSFELRLRDGYKFCPPDWRRIIPKTLPAGKVTRDRMIPFDPGLLGRVGEFARIVSGSSAFARIATDSREEWSNAVWTVNGHPEFFGLVAPLRTDIKSDHAGLADAFARATADQPAKRAKAA